MGKIEHTNFSFCYRIQFYAWVLHPCGVESFFRQAQSVSFPYGMVGNGGYEEHEELVGSCHTVYNFAHCVLQFKNTKQVGEGDVQYINMPSCPVSP
jgi:hypothetical protein